MLTYWSDVSTSDPELPGSPGKEERQGILLGMLQEFTMLWNERVNAEPTGDLVSMLAHNPATRNMPPMEFMGNLVLLIVGGNDTTRNSITGGLYFLNKNPGEYAKLKANHDLVENMVSEIIRYQTPLAHMRRTALQDTVLGGQLIHKGDKVVMWYSSPTVTIPFSTGRMSSSSIAPAPVSTCRSVSASTAAWATRLAELQLKILWEEILKRFDHIEVLDEPERVPSAFVRGYKSMMVRIPA